MFSCHFLVFFVCFIFKYYQLVPFHRISLYAMHFSHPLLKESLSGCGCRLDLGSQRLLCLWNLYSAHCSHSESHCQEHSLERAMCCWEHLDWIGNRTSLRPLSKLWIFYWADVEIYWSCSCLRQTCKFIPLLVKTATYQSGVSCLWLHFLLVLCVRGQFVN